MSREQNAAAWLTQEGRETESKKAVVPLQGKGRVIKKEQVAPHVYKVVEREGTQSASDDDRSGQPRLRVIPGGVQDQDPYSLSSHLRRSASPGMHHGSSAFDKPNRKKKGT